MVSIKVNGRFWCEDSGDIVCPASIIIGDTRRDTMAEYLSTLLSQDFKIE